MTKGAIMGLFNSLKEPVFLKETSNLDLQLEKLRNLELELNEEGQLLLKQDIKSFEYGIAGEANIAFELKNCHNVYFTRCLSGTR